jgi:hypothetical protein
VLARVGAMDEVWEKTRTALVEGRDTD